MACVVLRESYRKAYVWEAEILSADESINSLPKAATALSLRRRRRRCFVLRRPHRSSRARKPTNVWRLMALHVILLSSVRGAPSSYCASVSALPSTLPLQA